MKQNVTVSEGTIIRTLILALALVNQILLATGHPVIDISDETINELVSTSITVITAIIAWWKNNSFTENAILADEHKEMLDGLDKERGVK